jgi:DnaJ family protein C protein 28
MVCASYAKNVALTKEIHDAIEDELQDMENTLGFRRSKKLPHRHYLQYDGVGPGTLSERQRAYAQVRLDQSRESVFEKRFQDALIDKDTKEVGAYSPWPKSTQATNNLERIANEMIRDSIKRGEFSDLPGQGQPMEATLDNPFLSTMEQKISSMMSNSGFAPDWVMLDKEIRTEISALKTEMSVAWKVCGPHPMSHSKITEWEQNMVRFQEKVKFINKKIQHRNLIGPVVGQKVHIGLKHLALQVAENVTPAPDVAPALQKEGERTVDEGDAVGHNFIGVVGFVFAISWFWVISR